MARKTDGRARVKAGYVQMKEGVWYAVQHDIELSECCDCGLVHRTYWKVERGRIYWRAAVDKRLTKKARERDGITVTKRKPHEQESSNPRESTREKHTRRSARTA